MENTPSPGDNFEKERKKNLAKTGRLLNLWISGGEGFGDTRMVQCSGKWNSESKKRWIRTVADANSACQTVLYAFEPGLLELQPPKIHIAPSQVEEQISGYASYRGPGKSRIYLAINPTVSPGTPLVFVPEGLPPVSVPENVEILTIILHEWAHLFLASKVRFAHPRIWTPDSVLNVLEEGFAETVVRRMGIWLRENAHDLRLSPSTKTGFERAMEYMSKWYWRSSRNYRTELKEGVIDTVYVEGLAKLMRLYAKDKKFW